VTDRRESPPSRGHAVERQFEQLLEFAPEAVVGVGEDGRIVLVNRQAERVFGYARDELIGRPVERLVPERFHAVHTSHRGRYFADPRTRPMSADLSLYGVRRDGSEFPAEISLSGIETEGGMLAVAAIRDITDRQSAERRFEQLLEAAPDAIVGVDEAGRIMLVNQQVERVFGYARDELLGERVERLVPERFHRAHTVHRGRYFTNPGTRAMGSDLTLFGLRKDGTEFPAEISLSSIESGTGTLAITAIRDVTERLVAQSVASEEVHRREIVAAMLQAEEAERARIATSLHDDTIQVMTASLIAIDRVLKRPCADEGLTDVLRRARETIEQATERTRRLTFELRPAVLHEQGMAPAITAMVERVRMAGGALDIDSAPGGGTRISFDVPLGPVSHLAP
jgi:PAS domain S-box-containing protein